MDGIVERLRNGSRGDLRRTCHEAASEIERLQEIEGLAKQLVDAINAGDRPNRNEAEALLTEMLS